MVQQTVPFTLIQAKYLVDGNGGPPIEDGAVLVEGATIRMVGPRAKVVAPEGAPVDVHVFPDATVMPGLIDVHTHLNYPGDGTATDDVMREEDDILLMRSVANAALYLRKGVTTIRDNGAKNRTTLSLREGLRRKLAIGPRVLVCINPLTITGGHMWQMGAEADGVDGVTRAVRRLVKQGVDYIKVVATGGSTQRTYPNLPSYNPDELRALVAEAHKFRRLVAAHAHATAGIVNALDAGVDMLIHCSFREPDGTVVYRPEAVERIVEQGTWVNPTLFISLFATRERLERKRDTEGLTLAEQSRLDQIERFLPVRMEHISRMIEAGVKFVTGTDCGFGDMPFGRIHGEMSAFVRAGMTAMEAIGTVTRDAAASLGLLDCIGTLTPGKEADIAVFRGAPHADVRAVDEAEAVFQGGVPVR